MALIVCTTIWPMFRGTQYMRVYVFVPPVLGQAKSACANNENEKEE